MSLVKVAGNASGTGTITIQAPNTNTNYTLDLPAAAGTIQLSGNAISGTTGTFSGTISGGSTIGVGGATPANTGAGITFPATQSASSDANTLDDYEQGTFDSSISVAGSSTAGTYTLSNKRAYYTKIGNQVTCWVSFGFSAASGGTGYILISGFPFSYKANSSITGSVLAATLNTSASSSNGITIANSSSSSTTTFLLLLTIDNAAVEEIAIGAVSTSTAMQFVVTYTVD